MLYRNNTTKLQLTGCIVFRRRYTFGSNLSEALLYLIQEEESSGDFTV